MLGAEDAVEYGLIDRVVNRPGEGLAPDNE
jgi:ATP-dependent protease ClpP protease subunit